MRKARTRCLCRNTNTLSHNWWHNIGRTGGSLSEVAVFTVGKQSGAFAPETVQLTAFPRRTGRLVKEPAAGLGLAAAAIYLSRTSATSIMKVSMLLVVTWMSAPLVIYTITLLFLILNASKDLDVQTQTSCSAHPMVNF